MVTEAVDANKGNVYQISRPPIIGRFGLGVKRIGEVLPVESNPNYRANSQVALSEGTFIPGEEILRCAEVRAGAVVIIEATEFSYRESKPISWELINVHPELRRKLMYVPSEGGTRDFARSGLGTLRRLNKVLHF